MRRLGRCAVALAMLLLVAALVVPAAAQAPAGGSFSPAQRAEIVAILRHALATDPGILRDALAALQAQDQAASDTAARSAIGRAGAALAHAPGDPVAGNPHGDVTLVEFYDLRCPYCRGMVPVMAALLARDRNLRVVYKDIPVLGPASVLGARAVLAAQRQGGYLRLQQAVMTGTAQLTDATLQDAAERAGLDWPRLRRDMDAPEVAARIDANLGLAHDLGIDGTPTFVVGAQVLPGAVSLDALQAAVAGARGGKG